MHICVCIFAQVYAFIFLVMLVYQLNVTVGEKEAVNNSICHVKWELEIGNPPKAKYLASQNPQGKPPPF